MLKVRYDQIVIHEDTDHRASQSSNGRGDDQICHWKVKKKTHLM